METKEKPFSDTLRVLLKFSKEYKDQFTIKSLQECLGDIYHPNMRLKDILNVLHSSLSEMIGIDQFEVASKDYIYLEILKAPFDSFSPLGNMLIGPGLDDKFSIEEFYNKIITAYMHKFMLSNVGWCREYIFGKKEEEMNLIEVRTFRINKESYKLCIDTQDDHTEVLKEDKPIGLVFDSSTNIIYNNRQIGKLRFSYSDESTKTIKFILNVKEDIIDTGVSDSLSEAFLDAEVFVTKYLIENSLINV